MSEMDDKIGAILGNPELMQKIMSMAQSLGSSQPAPEPVPQPSPTFDPAMLQRISGMIGNAGIDKNQRALLSALSPYLSRDRIHKLENAMRAAKMAGIAANSIQRKGHFSPSGR